MTSQIITTPLVAVASTTFLLGVSWLASREKYGRAEESRLGTSADTDSLPSVIGCEEGDDCGSVQSVARYIRTCVTSKGVWPNLLVPGHFLGLSMRRTTEYTGGDGSGDPLAVLPCIRDRRSVFPSAFMKNAPPVPREIIQSLLDAALYGPFHGKRYRGNMHPAKFVVLGKEAMVEMQHLTLRYYDAHRREHWSTDEEYRSFHEAIEDEITGRWGSVSYMIAIIMQRQSGPRRFPEWEEMAATACAVQNMHLQSGRFKQLACYWSSWHDAARDSEEMKEFLSIGEEDKCMGFFIVAHAMNPDFRPRRSRDRSIILVEWRA